MLDDWSESDTHYAAIYTVYPYTSPIEHDHNLLSFFPLDEESDNFAQQREDLFRYAVRLFPKSMSSIVAAVADDCITNRPLARNLFISFFECGNDRYNLSVKDVIKEYKPITKKVKKIMSKNGATSRRAKLQ